MLKMRAMLSLRGKHSSDFQIQIRVVAIKTRALNPTSHHTLDDERLRSADPQCDRVPPVIKVQETLPSSFLIEVVFKKSSVTF